MSDRSDEKLIGRLIDMFGESEVKTTPKTLINVVLKSGQEFETVTEGRPKQVSFTVFGNVLQDSGHGWLLLPAKSGEPIIQIRKDEIAAMSFHDLSAGNTRGESFSA